MLCLSVSVRVCLAYLHTTKASFKFQKSSHTVPQIPLNCTSTLPDVPLEFPSTSTRRTARGVTGASVKQVSRDIRVTHIRTHYLTSGHTTSHQDTLPHIRSHDKEFTSPATFETTSIKGCDLTSILTQERVWACHCGMSIMIVKLASMTTAE